MKGVFNILIRMIVGLQYWHMDVVGIFSSVESNFYHMGTWNHPVPNNTKSKHEAASFYFLSQEKASWNEAEKSCQTNVGVETHLVYVETEKEYKALSKFLKKVEGQVDPTFWTGGGYSAQRSGYFWSNGEIFGDWVTWVDDGDSPSPENDTRVVIIEDGSKAFFQIQPDTTRFMYICELEVP